MGEKGEMGKREKMRGNGRKGDRKEKERKLEKRVKARK